METLGDYKNKAIQAVQAGRLRDAEGWLGKARELPACGIDIWQLSVQVNGRLGEYETATECCEYLLKIAPDDATTWGFLGTARLATGRYQEAVDALDKALGITPDIPMLLINRGCALLKLDRLAESVESLRRAVELEPSNPNAHFNLARASRSMGMLPDAIRELKVTLELDQGIVEAHTALGTLLYESGSLEDCEKTWLNALTVDPNEIQYLTGLAKLYTVTGDYDGALQQYEKIRQLQPENKLVLCGLADLYEKKGNFDEAQSLIVALLAADVNDVSLADVYARICHRYDACEDAIRYLARQLDKHNSDEQCRDLHFSLGYVYDKVGRYDEAFHQFEVANRLCHYQCDMEEIRKSFIIQREYFSKENIEALPSSVNQSELPVFIVGMPRSGTSLVEQIISAHADAYGAGELPDIKRMIRSMPDLCGEAAPAYPHCLSSMNQGAMDKLAHAYLRRLGEFSSDALRVIDKMPHNFFHVGLLCLLFPKARIIHCTREPADTCLSIFSRSFINLHSYGAELRTLGQYYREYQDLMAHWRDVFPGRILEVSYEALVADQEKYSRLLIDHCGLGWDDRCLEFYDSKRTVVTASYAQVRRPIYKSSIHRWRNYKRHLKPLLEELMLADG